MAAPAGSAATPAPAAAGAPETSGDEVHPEVLLWSCPEMYVYQIPPLKSESGHRANDWDVNKWLWTGKLCVYAIGNVMQVRLLDATGGGLFAMCPVTEPSSKAIDPVVDSSRYFVLRIDDGKGRHAFIGMGFRDRDDSYNFNATLQDHWCVVCPHATGVARRTASPSQPLDGRASYPGAGRVWHGRRRRIRSERRQSCGRPRSRCETCPSKMARRSTSRSTCQRARGGSTLARRLDQASGFRLRLALACFLRRQAVACRHPSRVALLPHLFPQTRQLQRVQGREARQSRVPQTSVGRQQAHRPAHLATPTLATLRRPAPRPVLTTLLVTLRPHEWGPIYATHLPTASDMGNVKLLQVRPRRLPIS
jgi:hypothetical protein